MNILPPISDRSAPQVFRQSRLAGGFSLFEMIIVMGIIGLILGGAVYSMGKIQDTAKITSAESNISSLVTNVDGYRIIGKRYPSEAQGLEALVKRPTTSPKPKRWTQTLDSEEALFDPWDTKYQYKYPGSKDPSKPEIISAGPDKVFGTEDDISSQD